MGDQQPRKASLEVTASDLGKKVGYDDTYNPARLFPIPRASKREEIGVDPVNLPFYGFDSWNHYEVSWLNAKGKPVVATAEIVYDCRSPKIIESKSMKLYFNSLNNMVFDSFEVVQQTVQSDLSQAIESEATVVLKPLSADGQSLDTQLPGESIDGLDVACTEYLVNPSYLITESQMVSEVLCSDLLKSNCLVTGQPDWGSVQIEYSGKKMNREGLLKYLVSFRNHNEFHEQCIERIFMDIMTACSPDELTISGRYTRRGGLDINPCRSTHLVDPQAKNQRLVRQ